MRVLVLGTTGMLGYEMFRVLSMNGVDVYGTARDMKCLQPRLKNDQIRRTIKIQDAKNIDYLEKIISDIRPDYIINCIGIVKQSDLAKNYLESIAINSLFPHQLAELCREFDSRLVHISTDCVFQGDKGFYTEEDPSDANDLYGKSKYLGEVVYWNAVTLRTSIIGHEISAQKHGILEWFLSQEGLVSGYTRAFFSGVSTLELSRIVYNFIIKNRLNPGLYQVAAERISKYELLNIINKVYNKNCIINTSDSIVLDRSLNGSKFCTATGYIAPPWHDIVQEMYNDFINGF